MAKRLRRPVIGGPSGTRKVLIVAVMETIVISCQSQPPVLVQFPANTCATAASLWRIGEQGMGLTIRHYFRPIFTIFCRALFQDQRQCLRFGTIFHE